MSSGGLTANACTASHPMQAVLDGPMGAHDLLEAFGRERRAHDVVAGFGCCAPGGVAPHLDLAEGGQTRPVMALPQPCDLTADSGAARLDAPVIAVNLLTGLQVLRPAGSSR